MSSNQPAKTEREATALELGDIEVAVDVWEGRVGWNASSIIDGRDYRVMGASSREDVLIRLKNTIMASTEATFALGIKNRRYWSPNPYWKGD